MNQRISELVQEAIDYADKAYTYTPEEGFNIQEWDKIRLEKFAELIVRECCDILAENVEIALNASGSPVYPEGLIYEHFGVEE